MNALKNATAIAVEYARLAGVKPRVHPNGFIQLDLKGDGTRIAKTRLHVWPDGDDIPKQKVSTTIHDHRFDMHSTILTGLLTQRTYRVRMVPDRTPRGVFFTHEIHMAQYPTPHESILAPTGIKVEVFRDERKAFSEGDEYTQRRYSFHDTDWMGLTATLMSKVGEDLDHEPRVLVPLGQEPDNSFVRAECDEGLLWDYIERALS